MKPLDKVRVVALYESMFNKQKAFFDDPSRYKAAVCSRRAGKTRGAAVTLCITGITRPETLSVYIALTRRSAKRIMWPVLKKLDRKYKLELKFNEADLTVEFPNGSMLLLVGANDEGVAESLRGSAYALVVVDEGASFRGHIDSLVDEIIIPALIDLKGALIFIGTPSADWTSYFYEATEGSKKEGWSTHHWTLFDNPHISDTQVFIDDIKRKRGWSDDNPVLQREYYGKWRRSADDLMYGFDPIKNTYVTEPHNLTHILGLDIGYNDATTISILGFNHDQSNNVYVLETFKRSKMTITEIAGEVGRRVTQYQPMVCVADTGGLGRAIVAELNERFGFNFKAAEKAEKATYIELLNSDLHEGRLKVRPDNPVVSEWKRLQWVYDAEKAKRVENPNQTNDCADSVLYAWREAKHWTYMAPEKGLTETERFEAQVRESFERERENLWWN